MKSKMAKPPLSELIVDEQDAEYMAEPAVPRSTCNALGQLRTTHGLARSVACTEDPGMTSASRAFPGCHSPNPPAPHRSLLLTQCGFRFD